MLRDITPAKYRCSMVSPACQAIFETGTGFYVIIGKVVNPADFKELEGRVGPDEVVIEVSADLIEEAVRGR